jgi:hypothetical protein
VAILVIDHLQQELPRNGHDVRAGISGQVRTNRAASTGRLK